MGLIADAVTSLMQEAGRTANADRIVAEQKIKSAIQDINAQIALGVLQVKDTFAVTSGTHTYSLPVDFGSMLVIGKYDSTGDHISERWAYTGEYRFAEDYETLSSSSLSGTVRGWKFETLGTDRRERIRLIPTPNSSYTAQFVYFALLSESTIDKLGWVEPLIDGAKRKLAEWFPKGFEKAERDYEKDIKILKMRRRSGRVMAPIRQHPEAIRANTWMRAIP